MNPLPPRSRRRRALRLAVRLASLAAAATLAVPALSALAARGLTWIPPELRESAWWPRAELILPALSPYIALGSVLARRVALPVLPAVVLVLALVILRKRFLCLYICPVGLLNDGAARLRPGGRGRLPRFPGLGRALALLTLGGAAAGYPLFLWLDPFSIFNGAMGVVHKPLTIAATVPAGVLAAIVILSAVWPGLWCQRLCPLGATQELLAAPRQWLARRRKNAEQKKTEAVPQIPNAGMPLGRRALLGLGVGGAWAVTTRHAVKGEAKAQTILPPGAAPRDRFGGLCVRCGNCLRACPQRIIQPDLGGHGLATLLAPTLTFAQEYCHPDCVECTQVCPSGAIRPLTLQEKQTAVIGIARVNPETCERAQGADCAACIMACLFDAVHGSDNEWEAAQPVVVKERCVGCGACELVCPAVPKAIVIEPVK